MKIKLKGFLFLLLTSLLWGSSFPAIKVVVSYVPAYYYVWFRSFIAILGLTPYLIYELRKGDYSVIKGGLYTGCIYALGLWLQGWGTEYIPASNSAFITGLNVVFVHIITMLIGRRYNFKLGIALILSILGLYFITLPVGGFSVGDFLVLLSALMWALQVIMVGLYCRGNPIIFTFFETLPSLIFIIPCLAMNQLPIPRIDIILILVYLGLVCSNMAFIFQFLGQRILSPAVAAIIFLSEPVFAAILSGIFLHEILSFIQIIGAAFIILAMYIAVTSEKLEVEV